MESEKKLKEESQRQSWKQTVGTLSEKIVERIPAWWPWRQFSARYVYPDAGKMLLINDNNNNYSFGEIHRISCTISWRNPQQIKKIL